MGQAFYALQSGPVQAVQNIFILLPLLFGVLIGVPVVARELERGTGRLAWSLAPSRVQWFVVRVAPLLGTVFVGSLVAGVALDRLMGAMEPSVDVGHAFVGFGFRGVVLAARAVFLFAIAVAAGAVLGRALPALLVAVVFGYVSLVGGSYLHHRILATEAVPLEDGPAVLASYSVDARIRTPDGRLITWDDLDRLAQAGVVPPPETSQEWPPAGYTTVTLAVPGDRYPFVAAREVAVLGAASVFVLAAAAWRVRRVRPG
jgi:hypothetical protein